MEISNCNWPFKETPYNYISGGFVTGDCTKYFFNYQEYEYKNLETCKKRFNNIEKPFGNFPFKNKQ